MCCVNVCGAQSLLTRRLLNTQHILHILRFVEAWRAVGLMVMAVVYFKQYSDLFYYCDIRDFLLLWHSDLFLLI